MLLVAVAGTVGYFAGSRSEQTVRALPRGWSVCANRAVGYAVAYPSSWHTADLPGAGACRFFDPKPLQIPENSDVYGFALEVSPAQESFDAVVESLRDPQFFANARSEELDISGGAAGRKHVVRVEATATGQGLYEKGLRTYAYVVDRGERPPLQLQTFNTPGSNWPERKRVLDRAVETLLLFRPDESTAVAEGDPLPAAVERKRAALLAAAQANDYDRLEALTDSKEFQYTYGGGERGPAEYWRFLEQQPPPPGDVATPTPAEAFAAILQMPHTVVDVPGSLASASKIYVWPFAYDAEPGALTDEQKTLLAPIMTENEIRLTAQYGQYLDWRAGITPDGRWIFFIAGD